MDPMALVDRSWPLLRRLMGAHTLAYRMTNGLIGHRWFPGAPPMLLLDHVGASREERKRLWPKAVATYGGYADYQERTDREIPLVILEPR